LIDRELQNCEQETLTFREVLLFRDKRFEKSISLDDELVIRIRRKSDILVEQLSQTFDVPLMKLLNAFAFL